MADGRESTLEHDDTVHHETSDVNVRGVLVFVAGLAVTAIVIYLMVWLLFRYFDVREGARVAPDYPLAIGQENRLPPEPRLQTDPRGDLRALRAHEDEVLNSYQWIDRSAGVVRIPIEEAIRITAQRGLPARPAAGGRK